jgi:hypothetical protein
MPDIVLHDTYVVWNWGVGLVLVVTVLILSAAALIRYLFFR